MEELKSRAEIEEKYKWHLEDIYSSNELWEQEFKQAEAMIPEIEALKDTLTQSAESLAAGLDKIDSMEFLIERLYVYSRMRRDEDNADPVYQALFARAEGLAVKASCATSWLRPLLLSMSSDTLLKYIAECPALSSHAFSLKNLIRAKEHVLSEKEEKLLAMTGDFSEGAHTVFSMLNNADLKFPTVEHNGETYSLSHGTYIVLMQSPDRELRKKVYEAYYSAFIDYRNTISAAYAANTKADVFYARARGYESSLNAALFGDNVPVELYKNLISIIRENNPEMYRYVELRRKALGVDQLQMYDIYTPLAKEADIKYTYEEAIELVKNGLSVLGEDYLKVLSGAFEEGWVDVHESKGKTSGAYSWGVYGTHPYVLLNHRGDLDSVFTIAHEMGHAMHTYYSNKTQPYPLASYKIFVAEVASTVNEILLTKYLLKTTEDKELKKYILTHFIDQFRGTVFRQTMFAEFEMISHEMAEKGEPLTSQSLSEVYGNLNADYYGEQVRDDIICHEWSRIPHFYNSFYVYKYATGFSCATQIASRIEEPGMLDKYIKFLSGGGSDHPLELLKIAGVDLAGGEPIRETMRAFSEAIDELEKLL